MLSLLLIRLIVKTKEIPEFSYVSNTYFDKEYGYNRSAIYLHYPFYENSSMQGTETIEFENKTYSFFNQIA